MALQELICGFVLNCLESSLVLFRSITANIMIVHEVGSSCDYYGCCRSILNVNFIVISCNITISQHLCSKFCIQGRLNAFLLYAFNNSLEHTIITLHA